MCVCEGGGDNNEVIYQAGAYAGCEDSLLLRDART